MEASAATRHRARQKKILLVDDSETSLLVHDLLLSEYPCERLKVPSGAEAIARAAEDPPDLVILDVKMPDTDGLEVLRELRANEETRETPVLLVTACADPDVMSEASRLGATDYLTKPVDGATLKARVGALLGLALPAGRHPHLVKASLRLLD